VEVGKKIIKKKKVPGFNFEVLKGGSSTCKLSDVKVVASALCIIGRESFHITQVKCIECPLITRSCNEVSIFEVLKGNSSICKLSDTNASRI
jgi:hypothetical protein